jgi:hypothetical protein
VVRAAGPINLNRIVAQSSNTAGLNICPNKPIWSIRTALMRSEQIAGWSGIECKPIRARAHYVALSAATPLPLNIRRAVIS